MCIRDRLKTVRGTVQADILKEDQAQNTCIFSTEFAPVSYTHLDVYKRQQSLWDALKELGDDKLPKQLDLYAADALVERSLLCFDGPDGSGASSALQGGVDRSPLTLRQRYNAAIQSLDSEALKLLRKWPARLTSSAEHVNEYQVRDKTIRIES